MQYYSENWREATDKFIKISSPFGGLKWAVSKETDYDIPYVSIGSGPEKIVINSGIHGIEGYFGSAAQLLFLKEFAINLSPGVLKKFTIVLIHIVNGWGFENRMREVMNPGGGLVDLNRNFGVDFSIPENLPKNEKYKQAHNLIVSQPHVQKGQQTKKEKILAFRRAHLKDGVWGSLMRGQYEQPYGLAYGGDRAMPENKMLLSIYDNVMKNSSSLLSVGMHTGLGRFDKKKKTVESFVLVSHPQTHINTKKFDEIFSKEVKVVADEGTENGPTLLGDLVDCLETRYVNKNIPIFTADFEIGTGCYPILSPVLKRMDMGDARYDLMNFGKIDKITAKNLTESWYPSDPIWRHQAMICARVFFQKLTSYLEKNK